LSDHDLPERPVAITFDDGYQDNLVHAKPILESFRIPATVFVTTGFLDNSAEVWSDELARLILLSREDPFRLLPLLALGVDKDLRFEASDKGWHAWEPPGNLRQWVYRTLYDRLLYAGDQARTEAIERVKSWCGEEPGREERAAFLTSSELTELASSPWIEIGAHSATHPVLAHLDPSLQRFEVATSKHILEKRTGKTVCSFAYPYGKKNHFNPDTIRALQSAGFQCGCANYGRLVTKKTSRWILPRYQILNWQGDVLANEMSRWYRA
ncbi:MAG TPA: polysaccharide deacetylase family protein, partial [Acidobacteriaceae bacterium]|nr:polysaccharide deacetylase family protein [Acidobacteriaceae bacterium]